MTFIKPDPEILQEEQEDLIMSYLNADYLSTETPLSPPSSTSSSSETTGSPEKHSVDDFMLDINTDFLGSDQHAWTTNNTNGLFNPCLPQQHHPDLLNAFPFFLPTMDVTNTHFVQPLPVVATANTTTNAPATTTTSSSSNAANEQPKKRRGRKKRDTTVPAPCVPQPSLLAPKPLAPRPDIQIKQEPMVMDVSSSNSSSPLAGLTTMANEAIAASSVEPQQQQQIISPVSTSASSSPASSASSQPTSIEAQKQAQIQKRQERLIKNRAAALLSRKRKREHLSLLEEEKQNLLMENENLVHKVSTLESRIQSLEKENMDLKEKLEKQQNNNNSSTVIHIGDNKRNLIHNSQKPSKATGVVFMIILFSFALFTLPSRTSNRLTVGGSSVLSKKQFPLIGSSSSSDDMDYSMEQFCQQHADYCDESMDATSSSDTNSTDLVLIDSVRPRDLQTWINHKLDVSSNESLDNDKKLISWFPNNSANEKSDNKELNDGHVYLYSKEFSQLASLHSSHSQTKDKSPPTISLVSPYNQTATSHDSYLQIDVQVLRSQVIKGQLLSLQQYGSASTALLDGMKKDLISSNVTRPNKKEDSIVKREKRTKKLSRVII